jgi:hypothetical protein
VLPFVTTIPSLGYSRSRTGPMDLETIRISVKNEKSFPLLENANDGDTNFRFDRDRWHVHHVR